MSNVRVYHDRARWNEADVRIYATNRLRIYATNRLRPNAAQGGVTPNFITDTVTVSATRVITYETGQVRMGSVWTRYGESNGALGEDWPRAPLPMNWVTIYST